jgi:hypothetical protein
MCCVLFERGFLFSVMYVFLCIVSHYDRLCGLVVTVPGYRTEMFRVSCEVRTEFIYVM